MRFSTNYETTMTSSPWTRRAALLGLLACVGGPASSFAQDAAYPTKAVTLVVPFPAGGPTDASARLFAKAMGDKLGQPFVVDNRAGAAGTVGSAFVVRAPSDGYTLLWGGTSTLAVAPGLYKGLKYDAKSFVPIGMALRGPLMIAGRPNLPAKDLPELIALAKAQPLTIGSAGNGSIGHLATEQFQEAAKIKLTHVPYRGGSPAITDAIGGQIDMVFDTAAALAPFVKAGKLKAFAVTGSKAYAPLPDVPVARATLPSMEGYSWFGLVAPANTPAQAVQALTKAFADAANSPEIQRELAATGVEPGVATPKAFADVITTDSAKWSGLIQRANVRADE